MKISFVIIILIVVAIYIWGFALCRAAAKDEHKDDGQENREE